MILEYQRLVGIIFMSVFVRQVESLGICNTRMLSTNQNNGTITVSSILLDPNVIATPDKAVLNTKEQNLGQGHFEAGGWVAGVQDTKQYLQIQLTKPSVVRGLVTQGRNGCCQQWVSEYNVSYSQDCKTWIDIKKTLKGNTDQDSPVENLFPCPVSAKCIRITPLKWNDKISMRVDVLGCPIIPISTLHLTTKPLPSSTSPQKPTLAAVNISSTTAMTQTPTGLTTSVYPGPSSQRTSATTTTGLPSTSGCTDASGIDCQLLQTQVKICTNPIASAKYCQKYCGLCGQTTSMLTSTIDTPFAPTSDSTSSTKRSPTSVFPTSVESATISSTTNSNGYQKSRSTTDQTSTPQMPSKLTNVSASQTSPVQGGTPSTTMLATTSIMQTTSAKCKDNPSIDCNILNTTVGICSNLLTAHLYCPTFCNVCGMSSSTLTTGTSNQSKIIPTTTMNPTTANVCQDRKGVDCSLLQKFYKVCQDKTSASTYCPRYCGLCVSTTAASKRTPAKIINGSTNNGSTSMSQSPRTSVGPKQAKQSGSTTILPTTATVSIINKLQGSSYHDLSSSTPGSSFGASYSASYLASSTSTIQTPASCTDKSGVDCYMLDVYFNLCNDNKSALMYCPLYCGICGSSTGHMSSPGTSNSRTSYSLNITPMISTESTTQNSISSFMTQTSRVSTNTSGHSLVTISNSTQDTSTASSSKISTFDTSTLNSSVTTTISKNGSYLTTTASSCKDAKGVDCKALNQYWNVCSNRVAALASCSSFCGLCGSSNLANNSQTMPVMTTPMYQPTSGIPTNGTQILLNTTLPLSTTIPSKSTSPSNSINSQTTPAMQTLSSSTLPTQQTAISSTNQVTKLTTGNTCRDKVGIDCHQLDVYLSVCSDLTSAQIYCPLYCGVCGSTAALQSYQTTLPNPSSVYKTNGSTISVTESTLSTTKPKHTSATSSSQSRSSMVLTASTTSSSTSRKGLHTTIPVTSTTSQQGTSLNSGYSTKSTQSKTSVVPGNSNMVSIYSTPQISKMSSIAGTFPSTTSVPNAASTFTTASCFNKPGVDCKQLDKYLNICQDPVTSMAYCRSYCGLCSQTTFVNTQRISVSNMQSTTSKANNINSTANQQFSMTSRLSRTAPSTTATNNLSSGKTSFHTYTTLSTFTKLVTGMISTLPSTSSGSNNQVHMNKTQNTLSLPNNSPSISSLYSSLKSNGFGSTPSAQVTILNSGQPSSTILNNLLSNAANIKSTTNFGSISYNPNNFTASTSGRTSPSFSIASSTSSTGKTIPNTTINCLTLTSVQTRIGTFINGSSSSSGHKSTRPSVASSTSTFGQSRTTSPVAGLTSSQTRTSSSSTGSTSTSGQINTSTTTSGSTSSSGLPKTITTIDGSTSSSGQTISKASIVSNTSTAGQTSTTSSFAGFTLFSGKTSISPSLVGSKSVQTSTDFSTASFHSTSGQTSTSPSFAGSTSIFGQARTGTSTGTSTAGFTLTSDQASTSPSSTVFVQTSPGTSSTGSTLTSSRTNTITSFASSTSTSGQTSTGPSNAGSTTISGNTGTFPSIAAITSTSGQTNKSPSYTRSTSTSDQTGTYTPIFGSTTTSSKTSSSTSFAGTSLNFGQASTTSSSTGSSSISGHTRTAHSIASLTPTSTKISPGPSFAVITSTSSQTRISASSTGHFSISGRQSTGPSLSGPTSTSSNTRTNPSMAAFTSATSKTSTIPFNSSSTYTLGQTGTQPSIAGSTSYSGQKSTRTSTAGSLLNSSQPMTYSSNAGSTLTSGQTSTRLSLTGLTTQSGQPITGPSFTGSTSTSSSTTSGEASTSSSIVGSSSTSGQTRTSAFIVGSTSEISSTSTSSQIRTSDSFASSISTSGQTNPSQIGLISSSGLTFANDFTTIPSTFTALQTSDIVSPTAYSVSNQSTPMFFPSKSPNPSIGNTNSVVNTTGISTLNGSLLLTQTSTHYSMPSLIKSTTPTAKQGTTQLILSSTSNSTLYSLSGSSRQASTIKTTNAPQSQSSNTRQVSYSTGTQSSKAPSFGTLSTVSLAPNSTVASSSNSLQSSTPSTYLTTITHDPCNDTLDCTLLDKFWGVCQNIATAKGCLSYCGFCPSGVPVTQNLAANNTSQSQGFSTSDFSSGTTASMFSTPSSKSSLPGSSTKTPIQPKVTNPYLTSQTNTAMMTQPIVPSTQTVQSITSYTTGIQAGTGRLSTLTAFSSTANGSVIPTNPQITPGNTNYTTRTQTTTSGPASLGRTVSYTSTATKYQTTTSPLLTTTHDPCNDTLDCQLLDKNWGICGNIVTSKGCLSYCGFCPSGVPVNQGSNSNSGSSTLPVSNYKLSSMAPQASSSVTLSSKPDSTLSSIITMSSASSTVSNSGTTASPVSISTTLSSIIGTTTPSCQDSPTVDCALIDKFWHVCNDIQTAKSCLRHCGFCP